MGVFAHSVVMCNCGSGYNIQGYHVIYGQIGKCRQLVRKNIT